MTEEATGEKTGSGNFIRNIIDSDLSKGKYGGKVVSRFPPEPNGYLHIGHAKSICLNFGIAQDYPGAKCHLRFDDTNPAKEESEYIDAIKADVQWLGFDWGEHLKFASDYYERLYQHAVELIKKDKAFVCQLSPEELREYRGTLTEPGKESPYRNRPIQESLDLFQKMREGVFSEGSHALRAKIDMTSGNINMRDPIIYRIRKVSHHRTGDKWCIYPMYDYAHCMSDYFEGITHSLCTLEFQDHRPLYDWFIDELLPPPRPYQFEFARLNLNYTITSKRKLKQLVDQGFVESWNDPRMPTIVGLRRRGYTPAAIRNFCERIGVAKKETTIDMSLLEESLRDDLNTHAPRAMCVQRPIKLVITNYPDDKVELLDVPNHPKDPSMGRRKLAFSKELYIERDDFSLEPPPKYHRLAPGKEVRLRFAYVLKCEEVILDEQTGAVVELRCSYDPDTLGKKPEGRKVKGIIHWLAKKTAVPATLRLYDRLFNVANPAATKDGSDFTVNLNPHSLETLEGSFVEPSLREAAVASIFQFERQGYFCVDVDSKADALVFNRAVGLKDTWGKE